MVIKKEIKKIIITLETRSKPKLKEILKEDLTTKKQTVLVIAQVSKKKDNILFEPYLNFFVPSS